MVERLHSHSPEEGALWAGGGGVEQREPSPGQARPASLGQAADVVPGREQFGAAMSSSDPVASGSLACLHSKVCPPPHLPLATLLKQVEEPLLQSTTEAFQTSLPPLI